MSFFELFPPYCSTKTAPEIPPPALPKKTYTPPSPAQQEALARPFSFFDHVQHEAKMNQWLMQEKAAENARKIDQYMRAYQDWKTNALHDAELATPVDPGPPPQAPVLEPIAPMPDGYWFEPH